MQRLYRLACLYFNFFQPVSKVVSKERTGAKVKKLYDTAKTPYQRLLAAGVLDEDKARSLTQLYSSLNPVKLRAEIHAAQKALWELADTSRTGRPPEGPVNEDTEYIYAQTKRA